MVPFRLLVHILDPVSVYCSSVAYVGDSSFFPAHLFSDHLLLTSLLWIKLLHILKFSIPISIPCCLINRRLSQFPFWGHPCFICPGLQLMTSSPFSGYHGLVHSSWQPPQSILLPGPFSHRKKPVSFWLFAISILPVSQNRKPPQGFAGCCSSPSVLHGSEAACECIPCPARPKAPLPCCPVYTAPGRLLSPLWSC